jgi:hypothetical protein
MIEKTGVASRLTHRFSHQNGLANRNVVLTARSLQATQLRASGGERNATVQVIPDPGKLSRIDKATTTFPSLTLSQSTTPLPPTPKHGSDAVAGVGAGRTVGPLRTVKST